MRNIHPIFPNSKPAGEIRADIFVRLFSGARRRGKQTRKGVAENAKTDQQRWSRRVRTRAAVNRKAHYAREAQKCSAAGVAPGPRSAKQFYMRVSA